MEAQQLAKITHFNCQTLKELYVKSLVSSYHGNLILKANLIDSNLQSGNYIVTLLVFLGRYNAVLAYPSKYASIYCSCSSVPSFVVSLPSLHFSR